MSRGAAVGLVVLAWVALASGRDTPARAAEPESSATAASQEARALYQRATAEFGLGNYAEAAVAYERAFKLKPDPALLFNAAQACRLAGNRERALLLYRNYLRIYPDGTAVTEARKHVDTLEAEARAASMAPTVRPAAPTAVAPDPTARPAPDPRPAPAPPPVAAVAPRPAPAVVAAPPPPARPPEPLPSPDPGLAVRMPPDGLQVDGRSSTPEDRSVLSSPWLWGGVGAVVVLSVAATLLATSGGERNPSPTWGSRPLE